MVRKSAGKAKVQSRVAKPTVDLLELREILEATSWDPATLAGNVAPGFTVCEDIKKQAGKVSPFSKDKKGAMTYDYPKGSPFKMVKKPKTHGETVFKTLMEANKRGMLNWSQVRFTQATLKHLQKSLEMLDS
jgi:hypothetical protein